MVEHNAVIETDHQLELEFPSILNGNDKFQRELFIYFALNVNWIFISSGFALRFPLPHLYHKLVIQ